MADVQPFTVEEYDALVSGGKPSTQPSQAPAGTRQEPAPPSKSAPISVSEYDELTKSKPTPSIGLGEDLARSAAAGFGRGAIGLTGLPGDVENLYNMAREKITGKPPSERFFPTSEEMTQKAVTAFPQLEQHLDYQPEYTPSKYAKTVAEFAPSAIIPGGGLKLGTRLAGAAGAGLATQAAENALSGTPAEGTGWETGAKIAASIPGFMAGTKAAGTISGIAGGALRPGAEAEARLAKEMAKDIATGGKYGAPMSAKEAIATGADIPPAAIAGKSTTKLLSKSSERVAPEVVGAFEARMQPIRSEAATRVSDFINRSLNIADDATPFSDIAAIRSRAAAMNDANYTRVMNLPHAQNIGGQTLDQVVNQLPRGTIERVADDLRQWGMSPQSMGFVQSGRQLSINPAGMPLRFWDEVKQNLDQQIRALKDPITGRITDPGAFARLNNTNNMLKGALDSSVREYPAIRGAAAEAAGAINAIDLGTKYLQARNPRQLYNIEQVRSRMSPSEQLDFANGVVGQFKNTLQQDPAAALRMFGGSKGGERVRRLNEALAPLGNNFGYDLVGRTNAELLNASAAALKPPSGLRLTPGMLPFAGMGTASAIGELLLQQSLWAGNPGAIFTALAGAGLGKVYNAKEARIAAKVLEYASDPDKMVRLGKLIAERPEAQSFVTKTTSLIGRTAAPAIVSDNQRYEAESNGGRIGRATGGKVAGSIAQRLVAAAEKAHKYHQKATEDILDAPDEHVVKALAVAKKHI